MLGKFAEEVSFLNGKRGAAALGAVTAVVAGVVTEYRVFDVRGVFLGVVSGYTPELAAGFLRLPPGQYLLKDSLGSIYKIKK